MIPAARSRQDDGARARATRPWAAVDPWGLLLALAAGIWHALLLTRATNDNFLHMTLARQMLAGDWPVRDFFEHGWVLQYTLSAAAQAVAGDRLLSEGLIVGGAWAVSTYLVFTLVRRLTGSAFGSGLAAVLLIVAGARGYSYPKGIVYAVAAVLFWSYVTTPARRTIAAFGAWAAVAFYWRPDHGVLAAAGVALALVAVHGIRRETITRGALAAGVMAALIAPFLVYVHAMVGLPEYVQTGFVQAQVEHTTHGGHEWPILHLPAGIVTVQPRERYAPSIGIRWVSGGAADARQRILDEYGLTHVSADEDGIERVRLSERSMAGLRALINEPLVEDTAGIERSTATLPSSSWSAWQRRRFEHSWLRLEWLPSLTPQERASEETAAIFYALALVILVASPWIQRTLDPAVTTGALAAFGLFALLVDAAMLRHPFAARAPDAVVLSAVAFGIVIVALLRTGVRSGRLRRLGAATSAAAIVLAVLPSVAGAGQFAERFAQLTGGFVSMRRAGAAWREAIGEMTASPPLSHFVDREANLERRLAAYVRECVPETDRLLVLWFAPDIYYNSDRLMAQRHLVFAPAWSTIEHEQRMTLEKVRRYAPPVVLVRQSALEDQARATYPSLVAYVEQQYVPAATIDDTGERYVIFRRSDRPPLRGFGPSRWPCYVRTPSRWARVGVNPE